MSDRNFKKQIKKFKKLSKRFCSLIPLHGKRPFENGWQQYCVEKRLFRKKDFKECNAGLTTGPANGIIVYDVDDISKAKEKRKKEGWELPKTLVVRTGSGNLHYYFSYPDDGNEYGNHTEKDPVTKKSIFCIRGMGGVIVAPGSIHPETGKEYKIEMDRPIAPAPEWMLKLTHKRNDIESGDNNVIGESSEERLHLFLSRLKKVKKQKEHSYLALCPVHNDHDPSLSIKLCNDGKIIFKCFAKCDQESIIRAVGLTWQHFFPDPMDRVDSLITAIKQKQKVNMVFDHIEDFAELNAAQLAKVKIRLKKIFNGKLNFNEVLCRIPRGLPRG